MPSQDPELFQSFTTLFKLAPFVWLSRQFYRVGFLASASASGLLRRLAHAPVPLDSLLQDYGGSPEKRDALASWLGVGVKLGDLALEPSGYSLKSFLAKSLARPENDGLAALVEEVATLHHKLLLETPERLRTSRPFTLQDQDARMIARSSRVLEPWVYGAIRKLLPSTGPVHLLEVGCGSGTYLRCAAEHNPQLTALGLELQEGAAALARANLEQWGLADRVSLEVKDIRDKQATPTFDVVTLHNNIYYFPVKERVGLLKHLRAFLKPGGLLLLTTGCQEGSAAMGLLDLWAAATEGCGRLPAPEEMLAQMREAGFDSTEKLRLIPAESFYTFSGRAQ